MKTRNILILGVATLVLVLAAAVTIIGRQSVRDEEAQPRMFPDLAAAVQDVNAIELKSAEDELIIARREGKWVVAEKSGYPADLSSVRKTLLAFTGMKKLEAKTANPELFERLDLRDISQEGSRATLVTLMAKDGSELASLLVGKTKPAGGREAQAYIRAPGDVQSWLVSGSPETGMNANDWLDKALVEFGRDRVKSVTIVHADGEAVTISRDSPADSDFVLQKQPKGSKLASEMALDTLVSTFGYISFDDVKPAADVDWSKAVKTTFRTFDGLVLNVDIVGDWCRFGPVYDAEVPEQIPAGTSVPGAPEDVAAEVRELEGRLQGWAYKLPDYKIKDMTRRMADFLEKPDSAKGKEE